MDLSIGSKLSQALSSATDAAKQKAASVMRKAAELAGKGAAAVKNGAIAALENPVGSAVIDKVGDVVPVVGALKKGYDYALKGDKSYSSADKYLDQDLQAAALVHCGGDSRKHQAMEKARRKRARERMIAAGKASPDPAKQAAATRLEEDMVGVERARLSSHVYDAYKPPPPEPPPPPVGFEEPTPEELDELGVTQDMLEPEGSTFRAKVYKVDPDVGPRPPNFVVAFRGTEANATDWTKGNIPQGLGFKSDHYTRAMDLAGAMAEQKSENVEFTGHSLGGGMASAAAVVSGRKATTQNSAGLRDATTERIGVSLDRKKAESHVTAYQIDGADKTEILSSLNKLPMVPDAVGKKNPLPAPKEGVSRLGLHSIEAVIDSIEQRKTEDQQTLDPR